MSHLLREQAPITEKGWRLLDEEAQERLRPTLAARKLVDFDVLRAGSGAKPSADSIVKVNYKGTLLDGKVFDSSYDRNEPVEFPLNQVVPGWSEGVGLMNVGSKFQFWIPSDLAYGEAGSPPVIGPNATLVFEVELLEIKAAQ